MAVVDKDQEVVIYYTADYSGAWEAAKAANWGYQKVYFIEGGAQAWKEAGYPIETGQ